MNTEYTIVDELVAEIDVDPRYLDDASIENELYAKLKREREGAFDKTDGLTVAVSRVKAIVDSRISMADGRIWLTVRLDRERFVPTKGKRVVGRVDKILNEGAFVEMKGFASFVNGGKKTADGAYAFEPCGHSYRVDDSVVVVVVDWDYRNKTLYCVGTHACDNY